MKTLRPGSDRADCAEVISGFGSAADTMWQRGNSGRKDWNSIVFDVGDVTHVEDCVVSCEDGVMGDDPTFWRR